MKPIARSHQVISTRNLTTSICKGHSVGDGIGTEVNDRQGIIKLVSDIQKGARRMNLYVLTHIVMYIKDVE